MQQARSRNTSSPSDSGHSLPWSVREEDTGGEGGLGGKGGGVSTPKSDMSSLFASLTLPSRRSLRMRTKYAFWSLSIRRHLQLKQVPLRRR